MQTNEDQQLNNNIKFDPEARPIWEIAAEIGERVPDSEWAKVPTDLSENFDKYQTETATKNSKCE